MHSRVFFLLILTLTALAAATRPVVLRPWLAGSPLPTPTSPSPTTTPTASPTVDLFAHVPTATPVGGGRAEIILHPFSTPALGAPPPTYTPTATPTSLPAILPGVPAAVATTTISAPLTIPTPSGPPPDRLRIPALKLDAPIEPAGLIPSTEVAGVYEWAVPDHRAAGWLETSAPFGLAGNTVLDGHHNIQGEVFRDLWRLQPGDEITLFAGERSRRYRVVEALILPEQGQPLETRLANVQYLQPTTDERLTLITCWPYDNNTHRTVVVALPEEGAAYE